MHFSSMAALRKLISPDILMEEAPARPAIGKINKLPKPKVLEEKFLALWQDLGGPELTREYRFHPVRRWRFDFAIPVKLLAIEIQGGLYTAQSGHRSQAGVRRDYEKVNVAQLLGWQVFQITSADINNHVFVQALIDYAWQKV